MNDEVEAPLSSIADVKLGLNTEQKAEIIFDFINAYRNDEAFDDFFSFNDLGVPMAVMIVNELITLTDKGLEVIEAHELFGTSFDNIDVVVHPQSVIHSMVEFTDGSTIAQLSMPDMRLPIGYALGYPHRIATPFGRIDWTTLSRLDFEPPDKKTFLCMDLAYAAGRAGGTAPAALSAAN